MVMSGDDMTNYPYILFNQSPEGSASHRSARRKILRAQPSRPALPRAQTAREAIERPAPLLETTEEAIAALDAQFFWLRGAGEPISRR
jgi:dipeptidase